MLRLSLRHAFLLTVVLTMAWASVVSASQMSPERTDPDLVAYLSIGGTLHDLCGDGGSHDRHDCPFCRLLSDPPEIRFAPCLRRATPALVWQDLGHLVARAQTGNPHISARAPPAQV